MKAILFDLDGVLVDAKNIHYETLNEALGEYKISWEEHIAKYDGLKTMQKLEMLTSQKGLKREKHDSIWKKKQDLTKERLSTLAPNDDLKKLFQSLKERNLKIGVCSNSIFQTVNIVLSRLELFEFIDVVISNEQVNRSKPFPEMYWRAMIQLGVLPDETTIVEDSPYGIMAAKQSGANLIRVDGPHEVNCSTILSVLDDPRKLDGASKVKWTSNKLNVLIPMAGAGSRFAKAGYTFPKPLIEVDGKPMIQVVCENLGIEANFIFIVQKQHKHDYNIESMLQLISPGCQIIEVDHLTEGAACTALLAKDVINNDNPLFFANSDQFVEWSAVDFFYKMNESAVDGGIVTFKATHPKWSFAKIDDNGFITQVAEKNPISDLATVGFYYWRRGSDFVKYAESMIAKDLRINNEFYVCPVYNEAIQAGLKFSTYNANKMWGIGTPEDLKFFLENYKGIK